MKLNPCNPETYTEKPDDRIAPPASPVAQYGMIVNTWILAALVGLVQVPGAQQEETVPFLWTPRGIVVSAHLNGIGPYNFLLDVRLPVSVVDHDVAQYAGLAPTPANTQSAFPEPIPESPPRTLAAATLNVGPVSFRDVPMVRADLAELGRRTGVTLHGILGNEGWAHEIVLDTQAGSLTVRTCPEPPSDTGGAVPIDKTPAGAWTLSALLNGRRLCSLEIDTTEANTLALPESLLRESGLLEPDAPTLTVNPMPNAYTPDCGRRQVRIESLRIGGALVKNPVCALLEAGESARIGLGFLRNYRVTVDFEAGLLRLERAGSLTVTEPPLYGTGIALGPLACGYWTVWVAEGSPAARAGVQSGDRLAAVDGRGLEASAFDTVGALLEVKPGDSTTLSLLRDAAPLSVILQAERLL